MDLTTFGVNDGYSEAILRGLRSSFLTEIQYNQLKNCNSFNELKATLEDTDYKDYLQGELGEMSVPKMIEKLRKKLSDEMDYIAAQSVGPLCDFINMMKMIYMIDNTVFMIEGVKNKAPPESIMANLNPLGIYSEMKNIKVLDGDDFSSLYRDVLIDTPVGKYFMKFLDDQIESLGENRTTGDIQNLFRELKTETIRSNLKKLWLEDFYSFTDTLNENSKEMMDNLLKFEADCRSIQLVYNTIGNQDYQNTEKMKKIRTQLFPNFGYLYYDILKLLIDADSLDQLRDAIKSSENYIDMLKEVPDPAKKEDMNFVSRNIEDAIREEENARYSLAFDQAGQYAVFYAYVKLKQIEITNLKWIAEMVSRNNKNPANWKKIVIPFSNLKS